MPSIFEGSKQCDQGWTEAEFAETKPHPALFCLFVLLRKRRQSEAGQSDNAIFAASGTDTPMSLV
jgi:hypothetical protein